MRIRKAAKKDIEVICILYKELFTESARQEPFHFRRSEQKAGFVEAIINGLDSEILLAEKKTGEIVGFALLKACRTVDYTCIVPHHYAYLMDLAVIKEAQGHGVGTLLLEACKKWARIHKLDYLELNVLNNNLDAIRLYERCEFRSIFHTMQYRV